MDELNHKLGSLELKLSAGTVIGPSHIQADVPNQDAYDFIKLDGFLVMAVADGAGSLARSDEGSELAVSVAVGMAADIYHSNKKKSSDLDLTRTLAEAIMEARNTVFTLDFWQEAGSTLVLAVLTEDKFAVAVVGDSFAVVQDTSGEYRLIQPPAAGEFANITKLLTSDDFIVSICSGLTSELSGLALCSDAFEHATLEQRVPTAGFWSTVFSMARKGTLHVDELIEFMDSQGKIEDDATLITLGSSLEPGSGTSDSISQHDYSLEELKALTGASQNSNRGLPTTF